MKQKNNIITPVLAVFLFITACNCNFWDWIQSDSSRNDTTVEKPDETTPRDSEKNETDTDSGDLANKVLDPAEKIGIPECDEFIAYIEQNSEEIGKDSIVVRGIVEYYKQWIYSNLRKGVANAKPAEREEYAKQCSQALKRLKEQRQKQTSK